MKRSIILYLIAAALIILAVAKIVKDKKKSQAISHVAAVAPVIPAEGYIVRDTLVSYSVNTIGTLVANESVSVQSEISQRLVSIHFAEGTFVQKGTLLFKLDDALLQAELGKLRIREELALLNEKRNKALLEKGGISQQIYDEQLNELKTVQAEMAYIQVGIDKTEVRAPFPGRIGIRYVSPGAYVSPKDVLAVLEDVSRIKLDFTVPERYALSIKQGQTVDFTLPGSSEAYQAAIWAIQPGIDVQTRNIQVRALTGNPEGIFIPGYSVKVHIDLTEPGKELYIPTQCLIPTLKGYNVCTLRQGKAAMFPVLTGNRNEESVHILEGVSQGDTVIMTNLLRIRQGDKVNLVKTY
jgi:membrane fusion protein (multidrug efflux system)